MKICWIDWLVDIFPWSIQSFWIDCSWNQFDPISDCRPLTESVLPLRCDQLIQSHLMTVDIDTQPAADLQTPPPSVDEFFIFTSISDQRSTQFPIQANQFVGKRNLRAKGADETCECQEAVECFGSNKNQNKLVLLILNIDFGVIEAPGSESEIRFRLNLAVRKKIDPKW